MNWRMSNDRRKAREWQARLVDTGELEAFQQLASTQEDDNILLARGYGLKGPFWAGLPLNQLLASHAWVTGATGQGKSYWLMSQVIQVLKRHPDTPIILNDMKGETARLIIDRVLPAIGYPPERVRVIRPFGKDYLPCLRVTAEEPGVSREVQSMNLAATLAEALAEDMGARMNRVFLRMATLAIELNEPLTVVKDWLEHPPTFAAAGERSTDPSLRAYAITHFKKESQSAIQSLLARLDTFFLMKSTQQILSAPSCVSLNDALESGISVLDLGEPPAGAETVSTFWAGILLGRLTRAIMNRPVGGPKCWVILEEFQESLRRHQSKAFSRVLALARFKNVSMWFVNQQAAQLSSVDPTLVKLLRTNTGLEAHFRSNLEDARAFGHALATNGNAQERTEMVNAITRLKRREFYLWVKELPFRAQLVRSPLLELDALKARAESVPSDVREAIRRGTVSVPPEELAEPVPYEPVSGTSILEDFLAPTGEELG